ncbi:MAG: regulatory protein RecX [Limnochordia bacterium]|jgi:regulatory protein
MAQKAMQQALRYLSYRDRTCREIIEYLRRKGYSDPVVEETLNRLIRLGYVDDRRFVRQWLNWRENKPVGIFRLRQELMAKGIEGTIIDEELAAWDLDDEYTRALKAAQKKLPSYGTDTPTVARKLAGFLQRRGFNHEVIRQVISHLCPNDPFA